MKLTRLAYPLLLVLAGCAGNNGGGTLPFPKDVEAVTDAAKAAHAYRFVTAMAMLQEQVLAGIPLDTPQSDPMLGANFTVSAGTAGAFHVAFSSTGGAPLGTADIQVLDGLPFPVRATQQMDATFDGVHMVGTLDLTTQDDTGLNTEVHGAYTLTDPDTQSTFDITTTNGVVAGTFDSKVDDGDDIDFSNVQVAQDLSTTASFAEKGEHGTLVINADGSGHSDLTSTHGTYQVRWDSRWMLTLVRPDGTTQELGFVGTL